MDVSRAQIANTESMNQILFKRLAMPTVNFASDASVMRGPMTRNEILKAREWRAQLEGVELLPNSIARPPTMVDIPESNRKPKAFGFTDDA